MAVFVFRLCNFGSGEVVFIGLYFGKLLICIKIIIIVIIVSTDFSAI